jgi:hypothetical protein
MDANNRLRATIEVHSVVPADEPIGQTVELSLWTDGFHDPHGLGGGGENPLPLGVDQVAEMLRERFDRNDLDLLLGHVDRLRAALGRGA